ncbi:hypothetical protein [Streptomyces erythrochromogenes]|uniref:hypothetical protein n=1 Tax=Streptomyces erythrochromogenes TaxID=285574 RepID=UPI00370204DE
MTDTVTIRRILPTDNPMGGGADVSSMRQNAHAAAIQRYRATANRINPTGHAHAAVDQGLFAGLGEYDAPAHAFSDVV